MTYYQFYFAMMAVFAGLALSLAVFFSHQFLRNKQASRWQLAIAVAGSFVFVFMASIVLALAEIHVRSMAIAYFGASGWLFALVCASLFSFMHYFLLRR